jgi:glycosyltransferase involved in cell wall biosynthesis
VAYVVKRYPRFSETFIVNEILAHEAAGWEILIFSLMPPNDGHFQEAISRVRAPVRSLFLPSQGLTSEAITAEALRAASFWHVLREGGKILPGLWNGLEAAQDEHTRDVYQAVLLAREARLCGVGHLHAHFATVATTVARLAARFAGLPYSFTAHAKDIFQDTVQPDDLRRKLSDAAAVVTVSDYNRQYLLDKYGAAANRVRRIYNGLDLDEFPYESPQERPARIVAVGRLIEKKGFGDLVDACAILARRHSNFHCRIIGTGPLEAPLRRQIEQNRIQSQVELLGALPLTEVARHIRESAALVAPCVVSTDGDRDGLPTVLLEAMALGTPCVSTSVTGIPEVVRDGETGLLVPEREPNGLATAIERLLSDARLRVNLARCARERIETAFDIQRNAAGMSEIFRLSGVKPACTVPEGC